MSYIKQILTYYWGRTLYSFTFEKLGLIKFADCGEYSGITRLMPELTHQTRHRFCHICPAIITRRITKFMKLTHQEITC